jgi:hypothetical protein
VGGLTVCAIQLIGRIIGRTGSALKAKRRSECRV